jgi:hypothetical protein
MLYLGMQKIETYLMVGIPNVIYSITTLTRVALLHCTQPLPDRDRHHQNIATSAISPHLQGRKHEVGLLDALGHHHPLGVGLHCDGMVLLRSSQRLLGS